MFISMKVRFGGFQIDADTRQLFGVNGEVHLAPKVFELLRLLVEARPRALSKGELQDHLWPSTFVSEANLPLLVSDLRSALGDSASTPRFIRTVPRFGYAFCGAALDAGAETAAGQVARWYLVIGTDHISLKAGATVLGRDPEADIAVNASGVSRLHARIHITGIGATVEDLGSKNGTFVKGRRVASAAPLQDGDEIRLGMFPVTFRAEAPSSTTETVHSSDGPRNLTKRSR